MKPSQSSLNATSQCRLYATIPTRPVNRLLPNSSTAAGTELMESLLESPNATSDLAHHTRPLQPQLSLQVCRILPFHHHHQDQSLQVQTSPSPDDTFSVSRACPHARCPPTHQTLSNYSVAYTPNIQNETYFPPSPCSIMYLVHLLTTVSPLFGILLSSWCYGTLARISSKEYLRCAGGYLCGVDVASRTLCLEQSQISLESKLEI